ncbi:NTP transferase domain-containing protein, partial [Candidatus Pacearchaeota archaeon]|nr:NTP transferase domain-containing protein [Candidatus Pacearchaeota archaeon]
MKAVILAGGFGKRLRIASEDIPKTMISIVGKPFLEHQIRLLKEQGIKEIILCVYYMADKIKSYFGDGRNFGVEITYSEEDSPLGTGGALKKAEKYLTDTFLVINSDLYAKLDINKFYEFHKLMKGMGTLGLTNASDALTEGNVLLQGEKIIGFVDDSKIKSDVTTCGIYLFEPEILKYIDAGKKVSLERETFLDLAKSGLLYGYKYNEGYFIDIGLPETHDKFKQDIINSLFLKKNNTIRQALQTIENTGIDLVLIIDEQKKL